VLPSPRSFTGSLLDMLTSCGRVRVAVVFRADGEGDRDELVVRRPKDLGIALISWMTGRPVYDRHDDVVGGDPAEAVVDVRVIV